MVWGFVCIGEQIHKLNLDYNDLLLSQQQAFTQINVTSKNILYKWLLKSVLFHYFMEVIHLCVFIVLPSK